MTYQLSEYPLIDLMKLKWTLDMEMLKRIWPIFIILIVIAIVVLIRKK